MPQAAEHQAVHPGQHRPKTSGRIPVQVPDAAEEKFCRAMDMKYVRITPRVWEGPGGSVPAEEGVRTFLEVMDDPKNYPVLVHCFRGVHRTGAHVAVYRMEYEHWTNAQAIAEVRAFGYVNLDDEWDVLGYLEQYRPRWWDKLLTGEASEAPRDPR